MKLAMEYIDDLQKKFGWKNDAETARQLKIATCTMTYLRTGQRAFSDEQAIMVAELLEVPKEEVLAAAQREKNPEVRAVWESIAKKVSGPALASLLWLNGDAPAAATPTNASVQGKCICQNITWPSAA